MVLVAQIFLLSWSNVAAVCLVQQPTILELLTEKVVCFPGPAIVRTHTGPRNAVARGKVKTLYNFCFLMI